MRSSFNDDLFLNETVFNCKKVLQEFHVRTENQLEQLLLKESRTVPCIKCGKEFPINELDFSTGDPICKHCNQ